MSPSIALLIPAYKNPAIIERTLYSIAEQSHRPIKIFISVDDPIENYQLRLERILFSVSSNLEFNVTYQKRRLGMYRNRHFLWRLWQRATDFFSFVDHDDIYVDPNFLKDAIDLMRFHSDVNVAAGNTLLGQKQDIDMLFMPIEERSWLKVNGRLLIPRFFTDLQFTRMATVYRASVPECDLLEKCWIDEKVMRNKRAEADESVATNFVFLHTSNVLITGRPVARWCRSDTSLSSTQEFRRIGSQAVLLQCAQLARVFHEVEDTSVARYIFQSVMRVFPPRTFNLTYLRLYLKLRVPITVLIRLYVAGLLTRATNFLLKK